MDFEDLDMAIANWIYDKQLKSVQSSNLLKTIDASKQLEKLGMDGFASAINCGKDNALYAFSEARRMIRDCECYYHQQEIYNA